MTTELLEQTAQGYYMCTCGHPDDEHVPDGTGLAPCIGNPLLRTLDGVNGRNGCGCGDFTRGEYFRPCGHPAEGDPCERRHVPAVRNRVTRPRRPRKRLPFRRVWDRDGWKCVACGTHQDLTVDHIVPVSKGGSDDLSNLQTMCGRCNSKKGARMPAPAKD